MKHDTTDGLSVQGRARVSRKSELREWPLRRNDRTNGTTRSNGHLSATQYPARQYVPLAPAPAARTTARTLRRRLELADLAALVVGGAAGFVLWTLFRPHQRDAWLAHLTLFAASVPIWFASFAAYKLYLARAVAQASDELRRIWAACLTALLAMVALAFAVQYQHLSRFWVLSIGSTVALTLTSERVLARRSFRRLRQQGTITRRVLIVGTDEHALHLVRNTQHDRSIGYEVVGLTGLPLKHDNADLHSLWCGSIGDTEDALRALGCDSIIISLASVRQAEVNHLTRRLTDLGVHVALSSSLRDISMTRIRPQMVGGHTLLYIEPTIRDGWRAHAKRAFDLTVASVGIVVTAPLMAVAALGIKATSPGPVFFRQDRVGRDGTTFRMIKFRTMVVDAEQRRDDLLQLNESDGPLFKIADDPRITRVGRILRKWSIDELPQFFNVLAGDMSVVGPRPALPNEVTGWDDEVRERIRVLPGITGLWQVAGRADTSFDVYKRLDLYYVDNWSLLHDLRIVLQTFIAVSTARGAR